MQSSAENLALSIVLKLQTTGHTAYFAGGCVRDRLMNRTPKDYDVATSALPDQVLALFPRSQQVGVAFGVVLVREKRNGELAQVEVATFRSDCTYSDGRHPDAVQFTTPEIDAQRRDFTCNGLFFDPLAHGGAGELRDFVGGQADIQHKILRAIGDPDQRFAEDHLRMLRAIRFSRKLGFGIETATWEAIKRHAGSLSEISRERISGELRLILIDAGRAYGMEQLEQSGLLQQIWPSALYMHRDETRNKWMLMTALQLEVGFVPALVQAHWILADWDKMPLAEAAEQFQQRLVLSNEETANFLWLARHFSETLYEHRLDRIRVSTLKRLMADPRWPDLFRLHRTCLGGFGAGYSFVLEEALLERMRHEGVAPTPFITGNTLIQLGISPNSKFRAWLDQLYDRQLENEFPTKDHALEAARKLIES